MFVEFILQTGFTNVSNQKQQGNLSCKDHRFPQRLVTWDHEGREFDLVKRFGHYFKVFLHVELAWDQERAFVCLSIEPGDEDASC